MKVNRTSYEGFTLGDWVRVEIPNDSAQEIIGTLVRIIQSPRLIRFWIEGEDKSVYCVASDYCHKINTVGRRSFSM
jgi:hypothetical protein